MKANETICVVLVTYNRLALLMECVGALRRQTRPVEKILVINNGSTDSTREWLDTQVDLWVIHQENLGGAGGFYRGVKEAHAAGYDWLWLMDDDVVTAPDSLTNLLEGGKGLEQVGFLCSLIRSDSGDTINVPTIDMRPGKTGYATWGQFLDKGIVKVRESTFVSVLIPGPIVGEVGLPIKEFFIWGDDVEFTRRISARWNGFLIGDSKVTHRRAQNSTLDISTEKSGGRLKLFYYLYRNTMYLKLKEKEILPTAIFICKSLIQMTRCLGAADYRVERIRLIVRGMFSGLFFNPPIEKS